MRDPERQKQLAVLLERRRRELSEREDISARIRELSQSSNRNLVPARIARRPKAFTFLFTGIAALAFVACIALLVTVIASSLWVQNTLTDPTTTTQDFYAALKQHDYTSAYALFSQHAQTQLSASDFADKFSAYDRIDGVIETYSITENTARGSTATLTVDVVRKGNGSVASVQVLRLVKEDGSWRIDSLVIQGTTPVRTPSDGGS